MDHPAPINLLIVVITSFCSWLGFRDPRLVDKYVFRPDCILARKQYYRLVTPAFFHGDWQHLLFNMVSLYFVGNSVEMIAGKGQYLLIYFGGIVGGYLLSLWIHRHHDYQALGASGGVCGIIFASVFLFPGGSFGIFPLPISIPGWLFAIIFPLASFYGLKAQRDNIGHDTHLGGAICGLLITAALYPGIIQHSPILFAALLVICITLLAYLALHPLWR